MAEPIKVGIWGLGRAGTTMHIPELKKFPDLFQVVAGCDIIPEREKHLHDSFPDAFFTTDGNEFLQYKEMDMVSIAIRSQEHVEYTRLALEAGKIVFLEKPFGLSEADADELEKLDAQYPGKIYFRHNRRFESAFHHIREIMAKGLLGNIYEIKLCRHRFQFRNDWQTMLECGGGQLNNWGPHLIDHSLRLLDSPLKEVWADMKRVTALGSAEDHIKIIFKGENGRLIDLEISDGITIPGPVYFIAGTRGTLLCEDESQLRMKYLDPAWKMPPLGADPGTPAIGCGYGGEIKPQWIEECIPVAPADGANMQDIYGRVYAAVRDGVPFPVTIAEAMEVVRTTAKIRKMCPVQGINGAE